MGLIDLLLMRAVYFVEEGQGTRFEERAIPDDLMPEAERWRHDLVAILQEPRELPLVREQPLEREHLADRIPNHGTHSTPSAAAVRHRPSG